MSALPGKPQEPSPEPDANSELDSQPNSEPDFDPDADSAELSSSERNPAAPNSLPDPLPYQRTRPPLAPGLYLVSTPIGNLEDISLRALRVLGEADRIACEDTRQTLKLLNHFGLRTPTIS